MNIFKRVFGRKSPKLFFLGLDGTPHTLLQKLAREGVMESYARILEQGGSRQMETTIPDISSVAWSTWMTGTNPAKHQIFGFTDLKPASYKTYFPNFQHLKGSPIWAVLGAKGKRSVILNIPGSYPARPMSGALISGFVAVDLAKATYPAAHLPFLKEIGYKTDVDARKAAEGWDIFFEELHDVLRARREAIFHLLEKENWDLFVAAITGTDRLQHFLWTAYSNPDHAHHQDFLDYYRAVDRLIGDIDRAIGEDHPLMVMSDHGFTDLRHEVYLNCWLEQEGYLQWKVAAAERTDMQAMAPESRAFCLDPGRIYLHVKGRHPAGCIAPEDYRALRDEIETKLATLTDPGKSGAPVIKSVRRKEDLYEGPYLQQSPDLVCVPHDGYDMKGATRETRLFGNKQFTGMHTQHGAHIFVRGHQIEKATPHICDVMPTMLRLLDVEIPANVDGVSLV